MEQPGPSGPAFDGEADQPVQRSRGIAGEDRREIEVFALELAR
jgi:hypothetical protein